MIQVQSAQNEFWTHIELAVVILTPIGAGLWAFFNKLTDHAKSDARSFGAVETNLAIIKGELRENQASVSTKLDAMWDDWKQSDRRRGDS